MAYSVDLEKRIINDSRGNVYTANEFKAIIEKDLEQNTCVQMTLMAQRFIRCNFDFDELQKQYDAMAG